MINLKQLKKWEVFLDNLNSNCYVPNENLEKTLAKEQVISILKAKTTNKDNLYYINKLSALSLRYINDAWFWYNILKNITSSSSIVTELCPGRSVVIDLALSFCQYKNIFYKIDYNTCINESDKILNEFNLKNLCFDILKETNKIPKSNIIVLNHAFDDLYMGVWQEKTGIDYFSFLDKNLSSEVIDNYWQDALKHENEIFNVLNKFIIELPKYLENSGTIIIRDYPSSYETNQQDLDRINFTRKLTLNLIESTLKHNKLKLSNPNFDSLNLENQKEISDTFYILSTL